MSVLIFIEGTPIPQGSKSVTRRGHMYEANRKLGPWRKTMETELKALRREFGKGWEPWDGPLEVDATFYFRRPARPSFREPAVKPDLDKLQRALGDALTSAGIVKDDARITTWHARKRYGHTPGVAIRYIRPDTKETL